MAGRSYVEVLRDHELSAIVRNCLDDGTQRSGTAWIGPERRFLRLVATPLGRGREGVLALIQDLSEVRRVETVRRDFIANVSHELRTPLTSLKAIVETLEEGAIAEPDAARDFLSKMHSEVDGMAHLVGELLELSRIESGQAALQVEALPVEGPIRRATARLEPQADRAGLTLEVQLPPELPAVRADEERIERVLVNLIHNAIKFTPPGGSVSIGAREVGGEVVVWVRDTGVGIDAADLPRIFERFYKADRSRAEGGTGLGLAIVKHLIQAHGGRIWAESTEGAGSTFCFTLPVAGAG
jgi:two-component system, OmpR family, phosphate regulon sensor histidine kinase PhoR